MLWTEEKIQSTFCILGEYLGDLDLNSAPNSSNFSITQAEEVITILIILIILIIIIIIIINSSSSSSSSSILLTLTLLDRQLIVIRHTTIQPSGNPKPVIQTETSKHMQSMKSNPPQ